jgi:hypothetical protein
MAEGGRAQDHDHEGPREMTTIQIYRTMRPAIILVILAALFLTGSQHPHLHNSRSNRAGRTISANRPSGTTSSPS